MSKKCHWKTVDRVQGGNEDESNSSNSNIMKMKGVYQE